MKINRFICFSKREKWILEILLNGDGELALNEDIKVRNKLLFELFNSCKSNKM